MTEELKTQKDPFETRVNVLNNYFDRFKPSLSTIFGLDFDYIDQASERVAILTFRYVKNLIRPMLAEDDAFSQIYKIAANTELAIMRVKPIQLEDEVVTQQINAYLAFSVASAMVIDWFELDNVKVNKVIYSADIQEFVDEHIKWLDNLDVKYYYPIFFSSQVWRLFHYLLVERIKQQ